VPASELSKAKRYIQLGLPSDFETTQQIAQALIPVALYSLPLDYYNNYVQNTSKQSRRQTYSEWRGSISTRGPWRS